MNLRIHGRSYMRGRMRTFVYVDGFNLYYGCLKGSLFKWLDIERLCSNILPRTSIDRIGYFTARVVPRAHDPDQNVRQEAYLRALRTNPKIEIVFGHFLSHTVRMPLCSRKGELTGGLSRVLKTEEKGSDVNLAAYLLLDAAKDRFDQAVVVTNDSDLLTPIRLARKELGKRIGIMNPHPKQSQVLAKEADFVRRIRSGALRVSQYPSRLTDSTGQFHKPATW